MYLNWDLNIGRTFGPKCPMVSKCWGGHVPESNKDRRPWRSYLTFWLNQSPKCSQSIIASSIHNVTSVKACGNLLERLEYFNSALENIRNEMIKDGIFHAPFQNITNVDSFVTVHGTRRDFFSTAASVRASSNNLAGVWVEQCGSNSVEVNWWSFQSTNTEVHVLSINSQRSTVYMIETPGMTGHGYDLYFNRTCNRDISINMQPQMLRPTALNVHMPSDFVTYTQIIKNGVVSDIGRNFQRKPSSCAKGMCEIRQ